MTKSNILFFLILLVLLNACSTSGPGIFGKKTPHEQYGQKITAAGLKSTALGRAWFEAAETSLRQPLLINVPYKETGYFEQETPEAVGLQFPAKRGEKISIILDKKPAIAFAIYLDFWEVPINTDGKLKFLEAGDTTMNPLVYEIRKDGNYLLRIQPELLRKGEYTVEIRSGPSLAYPIQAPGSNHIKSFWGADRDGGSRSHEGIDLFAARRTPVIASAPGTVTRVNENNLGGKVVWLRPAGKDFTLYYAHLDTQLVDDGQQVNLGDTLGLMGNTGNARSTSPHLHFGIYASGGAVDPLPFVNPVIKIAPVINVSLEILGKIVRSTNKAKLFPIADIGDAQGISLETNTVIKIEAATRDWYKVSLPDGFKGFVRNNFINSTEKPIRKFALKIEQPLLDAPDSLAARKTVIPVGEEVSVMGSFNEYYYINKDNQGGWISKEGVGR